MSFRQPLTSCFNDMVRINSLTSFYRCMGLPLLLAVLMFSASAYADVVVIVSARSPVTRISSAQIANIFLGKIGIFQNGSKAIPIDQAEGSEVRDEFYSKIVNKTPSQLNAYWAKAIFSGDSFPPKILDGSIAVRRSVANNTNAIGYIDKNEVDGTVRIVFEP